MIWYTFKGGNCTKIILSLFEKESTLKEKNLLLNSPIGSKFCQAEQILSN